MTTNLECWIYRSPRKDEMYLYVCREDDFSTVPEALLNRFGTPQRVMSLILGPERKLAREDVNQVLKNLESQGFHLQMPPKMDVDLYTGD
ncbi:MAG: YcgL domain-containing protein [Candidatus Thiodiazotropha sp.]